MQTHGGSPAGTAIESVERRWFISILVDWNRDGNFDHPLSDLSDYADNVLVDRSLSGSAPTEIMLIEGSSAAALSFDIGGVTEDGLNFTAVFSPYNGLSPFYNLDPIGCEVIYKIGIDTTAGVIWYQQFIGNIRTISPNRASNVVSISALDRVEKLRNPVQFPLWAMSEYMYQRGYAEAQLSDAHWVIDHCARFGETSVSPYRPMYQHEFTKTDIERDDGVRFWLTGNGGHTPTVGFMARDQDQGFPKTEAGAPPMYYANGMPHPDSDSSDEPMSLSSLGADASGFTASGLNSAAFLTYWGLDRSTDNINATQILGFTLNSSGVDGAWWKSTGNTTVVVQAHLGFHIRMMITLYQGYVRVEMRNWQTNGGSVSDWFLVPSGDHVQIDAVVRGPSATSKTAYILFNGTTLHSSVLADYSTHLDGSIDPLTAFVTVEHKAGISDVYWSSRWGIGTPTVDNAFFETHARPTAKYAAVLDRGLNKLSYLPFSTADDAWDIMTSVAAAELGSIFWDENGILKFWNRETLLDKQGTTWRTLNMDKVQGLDITNSFDSVRNVITAEGDRTLTRSGTVYEAQAVDEFYCPGATRSYFKFYVDDIQSVISSYLPRYRKADSPGSLLPVWSDDGAPGYVVQWLSGGVWAEDNGKTSGVEVFAYGNEDGTVTVEVWNGYAEPARFAGGAAGDSASAALRIPGAYMNRGEKSILFAQDLPSIATYGRRNLPLTGDWVQWQPDVIERLVDFILPRTVKPIPTTDAITIAGDPRLQLGDRVDILDPEGMGERIGLQIYGIQRSLSKEAGLVDTLTVEMIAPPRIGIWDSPQYGLWDSTFFWSA